MRYFIEIEAKNAAFAENEAAEVARILREVAEMVERGFVDSIQVLDYNGNRCGKVSMIRGVA